jgi:hypothetical protein
MTSAVKSWVKIFTFSSVCSPEPLAETEPGMTTVDDAALRGFAPTFLVSVGGLPRSRNEAFEPLNAGEGSPTPGLPLCPGTLAPDLATLWDARGRDHTAAGSRRSQGPAGPWPTYTRAAPGPARPRPDAGFAPGRCAAESVDPGGPGPATTRPGSAWGAGRGGGAGAAGPGPESERPRPRPPAPDGQGSARSSGCLPGGGARHGTLPQASGPENA